MNLGGSLQNITCHIKKNLPLFMICLFCDIYRIMRCYCEKLCDFFMMFCYFGLTTFTNTGSYFKPFASSLFVFFCTQFTNLVKSVCYNALVFCYNFFFQSIHVPKEFYYFYFLTLPPLFRTNTSMYIHISMYQIDSVHNKSHLKKL